MKPLLLCILDGVGLNNEEKGNAVKMSNTPFLDKLFQKYPHSQLEASGTLVGLPANQMGNSEVGHSNIGAGRIVYQSISFIQNKIDDRSFFKNEKLLSLIRYTKTNHTHFHMIGLVSDGGVHSSMEHIFALLELCKREQVYVYFHVITDGRDTLTDSSMSYIKQVQEHLQNNGVIASVSGRFYAMDRDNRYDRIEKAYDVLTGTSNKMYSNIGEAVQENYQMGVTDEFIVPGLIEKGGIIQDNDSVLFFNFRPDRLREMVSALTNPSFNGFTRKKSLNIKVMTMMPISEESLSEPLFEMPSLSNCLGEYIASCNLKQLRIAETEKYAHVTYFFDGGKELELKNCKRILIPSPKVTTYDLKPEMSAIEITDVLLSELQNYDVIILNFANGDMVGHTGNLEASIQAMEVLDNCVEKIVKKIEELKGIFVLTADHGNCEQMIDQDGNLLTSHTTNRVPFLINRSVFLQNGKLADIAPTILYLLGLPIPKEMSGNVLIKK